MSQQLSLNLRIEHIGGPIYINTQQANVSYVRYYEGGDRMGYSCCGVSVQKARSFLTKEERISMLKDYKSDLDKESQGVTERIKDLEKE